MTETILFLLLLFIIAAFFTTTLIMWKSSKNEGNNKLSYTKQEALLTHAERSFFGVLVQAIGNETTIFSKVRVADVIKPSSDMSRSDRQKAFNKISRKHFDFIICNKNDLSVICAIELNDSSHQQKKRKARDIFLQEACNTASIPLLQIKAKHSYHTDILRKQIMHLQ